MLQHPRAAAPAPASAAQQRRRPGQPASQAQCGRAAPMATDFGKGLPASTQTPSSPLVTRLSNLGAALSDVEAAVRHEELFEELRMELEMESTLAASLGKQARELEGELENSKGSVERLEAEAARLQKELHVAQAQLALLGEQPAQSVRTMGMLSTVGIGAARRGSSATVPCWSVAASASSPLTVWGRVNSANVQKVLWALDELAVPYRRVDAGMAFGVVETEDYLSMNPNGRIPTIDDNGTVLFESNVIVRYLGNKYAGEDSACWPADPAKKAQADMYMDLQQTQLSTDSSLVFAQMFRTPPEKRDMTAVEAAAARLANEYLKLEATLGTRPYLGGVEFTLGDIPLGCWVNRYLQTEGIVRPALPNVEAYYQRLKQRPAYVKHVSGLPLS